MPRIDKVAFFGDSYCFDTITKKQKNGTEVFYYPASETYLDIFANMINIYNFFWWIILCD